MEKRCYVCGKIIKSNDFYYSIGQNSFVCDNSKCYNFYYWDSLATKLCYDNNHKYVIVNKKVYEIGNKCDNQKGFGGRHWRINFLDGIKIETNSLWFRGVLPQRLQTDFKDNAEFEIC